MRHTKYRKNRELGVLLILRDIFFSKKKSFKHFKIIFQFSKTFFKTSPENPGSFKHNISSFEQSDEFFFKDFFN